MYKNYPLFYAIIFFLLVNGGHSVIYIPPITKHHYQNPHASHVDHQDYQEAHLDKKEGHESSKHHLSEEDKGHREHNSEKDHHSEQKDSGYVDKDKGRRKEGYRERGYKITAEREYFLNGEIFFSFLITMYLICTVSSNLHVTCILPFNAQCICRWMCNI